MFCKIENISISNDMAILMGGGKPKLMIIDPQYEINFDPFISSGTTMVASHQLNRKCYGMEIDSKYYQIIIDNFFQILK